MYFLVLFLLLGVSCSCTLDHILVEVNVVVPRYTGISWPKLTSTFSHNRVWPNFEIISSLKLILAFLYIYLWVTYNKCFWFTNGSLLDFLLSRYGHITMQAFHKAFRECFHKFLKFQMLRGRLKKKFRGPQFFFRDFICFGDTKIIIAYRGENHRF